MVVIIDYGAGNLQSVKNALDFIGAPNIISADVEQIRSASHIILPGVGSFGDAMDCMKQSGLTAVIREMALSGKPFLGICLGLHLLFEASEESHGVAGLGVLKGTVKKFSADLGLKVPHTGWNSLKLVEQKGIFEGIAQNAYTYFVHSYYIVPDCQTDVAAQCEYGVLFPCAIQHGNLCAVQFHPEKSADIGLKMLRNFVRMGVQ